MSEENLSPPRGVLIQLNTDMAAVVVQMATGGQRALAGLLGEEIEIAQAGKIAELEEIAESAAEGQRQAEATLAQERTRAETAESARDALSEAVAAAATLTADLTRERDDARLTIAEGRATLQQTERERDALRDKYYLALDSRTALRTAVLAFLDFKPDMFIPHPDHRRLWDNLRAATAAVPETPAPETATPFLRDHSPEAAAASIAPMPRDVPLGDTSETPLRAGPIDALAATAPLGAPAAQPRAYDEGV